MAKESQLYKRRRRWNTLRPRTRGRYVDEAEDLAALAFFAAAFAMTIGGGQRCGVCSGWEEGNYYHRRVVFIVDP